MESNMAKFKHNKLKNTGMLFEFLLRQVTVDVLNKEKNSVALQIIKKRFNEHTEVGKELALYNLLLKKKFKDDKKADFFLSEIGMTIVKAPGQYLEAIYSKSSTADSLTNSFN